ncbi:MAG: hypothetical protein WAM14_22085 [Candidatus Nitrosopolaris sp.]
MIQLTIVKRIVFLAFFIVLIVCLAHIISYLNIAVEGKQQVSTKFNVRITYPPPRQQVPTGYSLTIFGTSIYNTTNNDCTVYANSNDLQFQKVVAVGPTGNNDYSSWIFTYAKNYHPITKGINKLTAKISCKANPINFTAYYTTNVTGIIDRNSINTSNNLNQQSNRSISMSESTIHTNNNTNNYSNALASSNNNGNVSSSPFWFPNLFHNDISNINHNSSSKTIQSLQESGKVLGISIKVGKNPIAWDNEQTIRMTIFDPNSNQPISNAIVTGAITFPGLNTGITRDFTIATNNLGTALYSWLIADNNAKAGVYNLVIHASASGYNTTSALTSFTVMPIVLSNENNIQNKTNDNNLNSSISTLHTGLAG